MKKTVCLLFCLLPLLVGVAKTPPPPKVDGRWLPLLEKLKADGYEEERLSILFSPRRVSFDRWPMSKKLHTLFKRKFQPEPVDKDKDEPEVYSLCMTDKFLKGARDFHKENFEELERSSRKYGVPEKVIVAIIAVETWAGKNLGSKKVFTTLASMSLYDDPALVDILFKRKKLTPEQDEWVKEKAKKKAEWAYKELKALIDHAERDVLDLHDIKGSVYGAIGLCQFMPSNVLKLGVDGDGDGKVDLFTVPDAVHSVGSYLREAGWKSNSKLKARRKAIYSYNHSDVYVNTILAVAEKLDES